jgi:signal transduction histidine kinase
MLQQEILHLVHLVDSLQQLARADAAKACLNREHVPLAEAVDQMLTLYKGQFQEKNIQVEVSYDEKALTVDADRDKLLQAIRNLIENCWKYTPRDGHVSIAGLQTTGGIKLLFRNSGKGISHDDLPFIFERFFRVDKSRSREAGGAGIGLAIVKELIEAHGGRVGADSSNSETRIWFILPS